MEKLEDIILMNSSLLSKQDAKNYNPLVFAYVGDAVFSLIIRTYYAVNSFSKAGVLNSKVNAVVRASAQSKMFEHIEDSLTEEELRVAKSARNVHTNNVAKNSSLEEYKKATSFEALIGYLYLIGDKKRLNEIVEHSLEIIID